MRSRVPLGEHDACYCHRPCERRLLRLITPAEIVDEHLFDRFIVGNQNMANGVSTDEMTNFFRKVFRVISGAFE